MTQNVREAGGRSAQQNEQMSKQGFHVYKGEMSRNRQDTSKTCVVNTWKYEFSAVTTSQEALIGMERCILHPDSPPLLLTTATHDGEKFAETAIPITKWNVSLTAT